MNVYDPTTGTTPVQTLTNVSSAMLMLSDHPTILELVRHGSWSGQPGIRSGRHRIGVRAARHSIRAYGIRVRVVQYSIRAVSDHGPGVPVFDPGSMGSWSRQSGIHSEPHGIAILEGRQSTRCGPD